jgi:hypothetical protein
MKRLFLMMSVIVTGICSYCQCNSSLMEIAVAQSGNDALYVRDFKIKLEAGSMKRPSPVGRFQIYLNEGIRYRFNVANASDYDGKAILQLYYHNRLMGNTLDIEKGIDKQLFDFICRKTGKYQVLMSFSEGKEGCAVGVLSMVLSDTMLISGRTSGNDEEEPENLYLGIDNELNIAATGIPDGLLEVSISQGTITGSNGRYTARVEKRGTATVKVIARDREGNINEIDSIEFQVKDVPLPVATFGGLHGGMISRKDIERINEIELVYPVKIENTFYTVVEFAIFKESNHSKGEISYSSRITPAQKSMINKLDNGERFLIRDIYIRGPDGSTHFLKPLTFIIE